MDHHSKLLYTLMIEMRIVINANLCLDELSSEVVVFIVDGNEGSNESIEIGKSDDLFVDSP